MMNSIRILVAEATLAEVVLAVIVWMLIRYFRRRTRVRSTLPKTTTVTRL
jgi:hypothetical protein